MGGSRSLGRGHFYAGAIEGESSDLTLEALSGNVTVAHAETDSGGVAGANDDLIAGADGSGCGRDERFLRDEVAVGGDGNPGSLFGANYEGEV